MGNAQLEATAPDRGVVLTKAVTRAAARLGLSGKYLSDVIGVSEAQVSRMKRGDFALAEHTKPFELAALLVRVFRSLDAIVGGDDAVARSWIVAENTALHARPIDRMVSVQGLTDVAAYLDARRAPI
ncbi:MbcA/ParS/Xre antitoxin family protein [uncultured Aliiroseovarius sp.]|uniref:MbcA/ParS/Xre antitoxin family protein n=1 Tax=uncultured Aliiroseovarius sp. TaxID=1658783 RepID=UPI002594BD8B|nr:MbcA/ParS/Xre antitoxin family protein [uncultured Aliiroseovarius sp.]